MEDKKKFRLRLNLFDGIVLVLAVLVAGLLVWSRVKPETPSEETAPQTSHLEYVVRFQRWPEGSEDRVRVGDQLTENVKNIPMGTVKAVETVTATAEVFDQEHGRFVRSEVPGVEDLLVTVETDNITLSDGKLLLDGTVQLRVGTTMYMRGQGYMAAGPVLSILRTEEAD